MYENLLKVPPVPQDKRLPWYKSTAPALLSLFFYPFYLNAVLIPLTIAGFKFGLLGLGVGCLLSYLLYVVPAFWGMRTGYNAYILTTSSFGTKGAIVIPALLQVVVQIFYYSVKLYLFSYFILLFFGFDARVASPAYIAVAVALFIFSTYSGVKGIKPLAMVSTFIPPVMILLLMVAAFKSAPLAFSYQPLNLQPGWGFLLMVDVVLSYAGAVSMAGADFGSYNCSLKDVFLGGGVGIFLAGIVAGILALVTTAGFNAASGNHFTDMGLVLQNQGGFISYAVFFVFALSIIPSSIYSVFLYTNVLSTRVPGMSRLKGALICGIIGLLMAVTGIATDFRSILNFLGAAFSPVLGVVYAEYLLVHKGNWPGPFPGINWAGYAAWLPGFIIGILPNPLWNLLFGLKLVYAPVNLYAFLASFLCYAVFARLQRNPAK